MKCFCYKLIDDGKKVVRFFQILKTTRPPALERFCNIKMELLSQKNCTLVSSMSIKNCKIADGDVAVDSKVLYHLV